MADVDAEMQRLSESFAKVEQGGPPMPTSAAALLITSQTFRRPSPPDRSGRPSRPRTRRSRRYVEGRMLATAARHAANTTQEFEKLKDDEVVWKLVGPVLLKQDKVEAESTVDGRLEFIGKELLVCACSHP